jgi:hypothetical protein
MEACERAITICYVSNVDDLAFAISKFVRFLRELPIETNSTQGKASSPY